MYSISKKNKHVLKHWVHAWSFRLYCYWFSHFTGFLFILWEPRGFKGIDISILGSSSLLQQCFSIICFKWQYLYGLPRAYALIFQCLHSNIRSFNINQYCLYLVPNLVFIHTYWLLVGKGCRSLSWNLTGQRASQIAADRSRLEALILLLNSDQFILTMMNVNFPHLLKSVFAKMFYVLKHKKSKWKYNNTKVCCGSQVCHLDSSFLRLPSLEKIHFT